MRYCEHKRVCGRSALPGLNACILHCEDPEKDKEKFEHALEEHLSEKGPTFREMVVPIALKYKGRNYNALDLTGAVFLEPVKFLDCTFEDQVIGFNTTFKDGCAFNGSEFKRGARFRKTRFEDYLDFTGAVVHQESAFTYSAIRGKAKFSSSTLHDANFGARTFEGEADFGEVDFKGSRAYFGDTEFQEQVLFKGATFEGSVVFGGQFGGEAVFSSATFERSSTFADAEFTGPVSFSRSTFQKSVWFRGTCFEQEASFREVTFWNDCSFQDVKLEQASFEEIKVAEDLLFSDTFTSGNFEYASFDDGHIEGSLTIQGKSEDDRPFSGGVVSFQNVSQTPDASIRFRYPDLRRCRFLNTDLRTIDFLGVEWCDELADRSALYGEWFSRVGLYDEVTPVPEQGESSDRRPWPEIERLYRQLKLNYENRGDFPRAGDFHIGEKEARRRNPETQWGPWLLLTAYRALSKYGERALPAFFWLTFVTLVSMTGYVFLEAIPGGETVPLSPENTTDWMQGLAISIETAFFPVRPAGFQSAAPRLLNVAQRILSPPLIALLALALRQRVKR
jgi:uncharacterized protein YjbI with pentapeptide repeats